MKVWICTAASTADCNGSCVPSDVSYVSEEEAVGSKTEAANHAGPREVREAVVHVEFACFTAPKTSHRRIATFIVRRRYDATVRDRVTNKRTVCLCGKPLTLTPYGNLPQHRTPEKKPCRFGNLNFVELGVPAPERPR